MIKDFLGIIMLSWLIELIAAIAKAMFQAIKFIVVSPFEFVVKQLQKPENTEGKVKRVIDGDSIIVETEQGVKEVRIKGIDAPEHGQEGYGPAKWAVERMALGHEVVLKNQELDQYGRTVAEVGFKDKELNPAEELAAKGLAYPDPHTTTRKIKDIAKTAKKEKKGVWNSNEPPPWEFRDINGI